MKPVFVSYSRINLDVVAQLIHDLQAVGVQTWHDQTLSGGQRWWDNIVANIRDCDIFVFALSPESWESEACRNELTYATQLGKVILPVLVADGINLNLLPPPINEIQITDYRRRDKESAFAVLKSINTAPSAALLPDPLPQPPRVPVSYLSNMKERIDSADTLSSQEQISLIFELEAGLRDGRSSAEIRELLLTLKRRNDLLAKVATRIDEALEALEDKTPADRNQAEPARLSPATDPLYRDERQNDNHRRAEERGLCPKCRAHVNPGARFCSTCALALEGHDSPAAAAGSSAAPARAYEQSPSSPRAPGAKIRRYACPPNATPQLIADVRNWLDAEGFDCQKMNTDGDGTLVQIKRRGGWREFTGMATSLNIIFRQSSEMLVVEIGAGKWIDKAAVGTVSMFILWPLVLTAGYGAWEQMKMPDKIFAYIGNRFVYS